MIDVGLLFALLPIQLQPTPTIRKERRDPTTCLAFKATMEVDYAEEELGLWLVTIWMDWHGYHRMVRTSVPLTSF